MRETSLLKSKATTTYTTSTATKNEDTNNGKVNCLEDLILDNKIKRKIENALEGLPFQCFNYFVTGCYQHLSRMYRLYAITYLL